MPVDGVPSKKSQEGLVSIRESDIEQYFCKELKKYPPWTQFKFKSTVNFVPDRIVFGPGVAYLIEFKAENGKLSAGQELCIKMFEKLLIRVDIISSKYEVDQWIKENIV